MSDAHCSVPFTLFNILFNVYFGTFVSTRICIHWFIYFLSTQNPSAVYICHEIIRCEKNKLLITYIFAGTWNEIQQHRICSLTEYMVGCAWYKLHGISPFALDSLTLNFSYNETSTEVDMRLFYGTVVT